MNGVKSDGESRGTEADAASISGGGGAGLRMPRRCSPAGMRIRDGAVTGWHNEIRGASALAVAGSRVALFGGYGPDRDRLALAELRADRAGPAGEYRVVLPDGEPFPEGAQMIGRGSRLHFFTGTSWYRLDGDDSAAARHVLPVHLIARGSGELPPWETAVMPAFRLRSTA